MQRKTRPTRWRAVTGVLSAFCLIGSALVIAAPASAASVTRTFESDAAGSAPAGCTYAAGSVAGTVTTTRAYQGTKSLRINDQSSSVSVTTQCRDATRAGGDLSFQLYPAALANGFSFSLLGHVQNISTERTVFHFNLLPNGALRWYDGLGWTQITPAGTVPFGQWSSIRLQVPSSQEVAYLYVNGTYVGEGGPWGVRAVTDTTGFQFSSAGTATYGDEVSVDNVVMGDAVNTPPAVSRPFSVASDVTIATGTTTPVLFPNTAVNVTVNGQNQTLVSYPAHTDANETSGNQLAVTTDGGSTWASAQSRNPMPDAPSYGLTKLRNGDILAVDYHTYMTSGSNNLQANVPTAISHDNGQTWTQRNGVMTTPQAMRNIASTTDKPGFPLGGFVLVHSVVEDADGTLYQSGYGYYANDTKYRQIVMKSTDGGINWGSVATVGYNPSLSSNSSYEGFDEGAIARVKDGSLLIVMRTGSFQQMYTSRSTDNGATWSTPAPFTVNSVPVTGIYPTLTLLPSGVLLLWIGRPGQSLLASTDGNGASWTSPQTVDYRNSGNGTFIPLDNTHLLTFGDRGADWANPQPVQYRVWSRKVTLTLS